MKKVAILYSEYSAVIDAIKYQLSDYEVDCLTEPKKTEKYDLVILSNYYDEFKGNALKCHHSLLPAFDCDEPVKKAILEGVKVTGITIYFTNPFKILAQYPVFINNNTHFDELEKELEYIEQTLFPLVAERILKNEPFEVRALLNKTCSGNCGGCKGCNH